MIKLTWRGHFRLPPFAEKATDGATHCVGNATRSKAWGSPPGARLLHLEKLLAFRLLYTSPGDLASAVHEHDEVFVVLQLV